MPQTPTEHVDLEAFKTAVAWPNPTVDSFTNLVNRYNAAGLHGEAAGYFAEREAATRGSEAHPWMLAAAGLFEALDAGSVPLLRRRGAVREAVAKLDDAVAEETGLSRYLRGVVLVNLPSSFEETERGVEDLNWVIANQESFPPGIVRAAWRELSKGYTALGDEARAADALAISGHAATTHEGTFSTPSSVRAQEGFRFGIPRVLELGSGIYQVESHDFGDIGFIETDEGFVAIDAGTFPENAAAALEAVQGFADAPVHTVVLTHGHWDHIGGVSAFTDAGATVVTQADFEASVEAISRFEPPPFSWFFGQQSVNLDVTPDVVIGELRSLGTSRLINLVPVRGGETEDALLIHVPDAGVVFVGDAFMPFLGAPFTEEGNPVALLDTIDTIVSLEPTRIVHGHPPLTELWTIEVLPDLRNALAQLIDATTVSIASGRTLAESLRDNVLPESLREAPKAVLPYITMREGVIKRLYDNSTGYWQADREGLETLALEDWSRALDLLGGNERSYVRAVEALLEGGEGALPLRLADIGLVSYPESTKLADLRKQALQRLRSVHHVSNPFKFIVYSETVGDELAPFMAAEPL
ncbi:MAG: MBL fold metallo-hydrolase [Myxococcota bacterium]